MKKVLKTIGLTMATGILTMISTFSLMLGLANNCNWIGSVGAITAAITFTAASICFMSATSSDKTNEI